MDAPLTVWYCDVCGNAIDLNLNKGCVISKVDNNNKHHDFKIVHKINCRSELDDHSNVLDIEDYLSDNGIALLLSDLSDGPHRNRKNACCIKDLDEFVDLFRRLQTPYYEEARKQFKNQQFLADFADENEVRPYLPKTLEDIIRNYP